MHAPAPQVQVTEAGRRVLRHLHPKGSTFPMAQALDEIEQAVTLGRLLREAVEAATVEGAVHWDEAAAIVMAKRKATP